MMTIALNAGVADDGDAEEDDGLVEGRDEQRADDGAAERELPAGERGAADDDGEDRVELELVAGARDVDRHHAPGREDAGDAGEHAAQRCRR